jgi:hypothetical protein
MGCSVGRLVVMDDEDDGQRMTNLALETSRGAALRCTASFGRVSQRVRDAGGCCGLYVACMWLAVADEDPYCT